MCRVRGRGRKHCVDEAGSASISHRIASWERFCCISSSFVVDEVSNIIKESIESAIGGNAYQHNKVNQWTTNVVEQTLSQLTKLGKPFKYIVTCVIMQKNGAGLHTASSCFWDNATDGKFSLHLKYNHFVRLGEAGEDGQVMVACFVNVQTLHKVHML
uniref:Dynein light chain Tctex-type 1 n=1 Tax=Engystomops pustulosus TaxID=76066 RepID=A0AAV6YYL8_ENGPU|nr:hypothetical protein GDO81_021494 [Engystomops pustulosus]